MRAGKHKYGERAGRRRPAAAFRRRWHARKNNIMGYVAAREPRAQRPSSAPQRSCTPTLPVLPGQQKPGHVPRHAVQSQPAVPRAQGGQTTWENCVPACVACNSRKANRTPEQAAMKLRRPPFRPAWKPLYDASTVRIASWSRFLSDAYWNVPLLDSD